MKLKIEMFNDDEIIETRGIRSFSVFNVHSRFVHNKSISMC